MPVEIDNQYHNVYVLKRPGVDEFMRKMGEKYEIVVFTASLSKVSFWGVGLKQVLYDSFPTPCLVRRSGLGYARCPQGNQA